MPRGNETGRAGRHVDDGLSRLSFEHPIPQKVRDHGHAIDPRILEPGDLLLVSKKNKPWISKKIVAYQEMLFAPEHACWHHAAVSGGRFEICEATLRGIRSREYWEYMTGEYDIRVRRLKNATSAERSLVAYYAAVNVRTGYAYLNLLNIKQILSSGNSWRRPIQLSTGVICSQLYFEACMRIGFLLAGIPPEAVCPAHLSMSPQLIDIPVTWVPV